MHRTTTLAWFASAAAIMTACTVTKPPAAHASLAVGNKYVFRGVPQAENGVAQGDMGLAVTDDDGGTFSLTGWGNMNLSNDSGDAIFPDGNGGKFTEIDIVPEYSRPFGQVTVAAGVVNYNFPNRVGTSTSEVYLAGSLDTLFVPKLTVYCDVDEVKGLYAQGSVSHPFALGKELSAEARLSLGYAGSDEGKAYWLDHSAGFADLVASLTLSHDLSKNVKLTGTFAASTILAHAYRSALDRADVDADNFQVLVGAVWSF